MKMKLASLALAAFATVQANAATFVLSNVVSFDGTGDVLIERSESDTGARLTGGVVAMGYFPVGFDLSGGLNNIQNIVAGFTVITSGAVGLNSENLGLASAGYYDFAGTTPFTVNATTNQQLLGRALYLFAGNGATLAGSSYFGLQQIGTILSDDPFPQTYVSSQVPPVPVFGIGTVGTFTGDASGAGSATYTTLQLAAIPEPSAALLGAVGALGLLRRRRA